MLKLSAYDKILIDNLEKKKMGEHNFLA